jgi:signal transduction histidine kinase
LSISGVLLHDGQWTGLHDSGWWIGVSANAIIAVAFLAVAVVLAVNAIKTRQVKNNPLGLATVVLYITCGGGHVVHTVQLIQGPLGVNAAVAAAAAFEYSNEWHMWAIDLLTMIAGVSYWMMRRRFPALVSGAAVFEDLRGRQKRALEIHDNVIQGLVQAQMALSMDMEEEGTEAVSETLEKARGIITDLLGDEEITPGILRRAHAGGEPHGP